MKKSEFTKLSLFLTQKKSFTQCNKNKIAKRLPTSHIMHFKIHFVAKDICFSDCCIPPFHPIPPYCPTLLYSFEASINGPSLCASSWLMLLEVRFYDNLDYESITKPLPHCVGCVRLVNCLWSSEKTDNYNNFTTLLDELEIRKSFHRKLTICCCRKLFFSCF